MTSDGWPIHPIGQLVERVVQREAVEPTTTYKLLGVRGRSQGAFIREEKAGEQVRAKYLYRVRSGLFIYNRLFASTGSFAVIGPAHGDCFVSNEFPHYECDPSALLAEYLNLWFQLPSTVNMVAEQCTGTTQSRLRWKERDFERTQIPVPPVAEQRRIVDLIARFDDAIVRAEHAERRIADALRALREDLLQPGASLLGDVATVRSGPSWAAGDERTTATATSMPVMKITNTRPDGTIDLTEVVHVEDLPASTWGIDDDTLVLIRTNGNRSRIGNVYRPPAAANGFAVSAFQMIIDVDPSYGRDLLFHYLAGPTPQQQMSHAASGTTGLGNLAVKWLRTLPVPDTTSAIHLPLLDDAQTAVQAAAALLFCLRNARVAILADLLSGERVIPGSYDRFLDGVAA